MIVTSNKATKCLKVGDLVRYEDMMEQGIYRLGYITDVMDYDGSGFPMYEVVCTEPYDRGWFSDLVLEVVSELG